MAIGGDHDDVTTPDRDTEHAQTNIIPLLQSGRLKVTGNYADTEPTNPPKTEPTNPPKPQPTNPPEVISTTSNAPGHSPKLLWVMCGCMALFK
uniref:Uncharacterized protein LOC100175345 n=1 Tax=Phallusia mammillata TaxID=59560 RepID=A0A6F9DGA4_9ASCI|nr:uncharacterized protein LOC100175345 [Phallusia mammillata]